MDFESPDAMKDFPGLYACDLNKKGTNDSDYSDDGDKVTKKDLLIGKRKDKKDKKDKERGYAALEGESSADENFDARSPSKSKKSKSFKFTSKSKEKREKSRDKEKECNEKKKDKDKKLEKKLEKEKKSDKKERKTKHCEEYGDIADRLPIFGVHLELAIERSRCHDGIDLPLPVRACIDYMEAYGLNFEGVYKITGTKSKVLQLRKMYNSREDVDLKDYDVPTATSLLKMFLRDLPEPIFTNELMVRFEEAGAILNVATREKHLKILVENLPTNNRLLLSWLLIHFDNIIMNEKVNKANIQTVVTTFSPVLHASNRLLTVLLYHCHALFPNTIVKPYDPPLTSTAQLPDEPELIEVELQKQESLLSQIHTEVHTGFISKQREELMWEVQRIITQLKRKLKNVQKDKDQVSEKNVDDKVQAVSEPEDINDVDELNTVEEQEGEESTADSHDNVDMSESAVDLNSSTKDLEKAVEPKVDEAEETAIMDGYISLVQFRNSSLIELKDKLLQCIEEEKKEIQLLKTQLNDDCDNSVPVINSGPDLDEIMTLLNKENQILQIKKINLVRQIMEHHESCIEMKARLNLLQVSM